MIFARVSIPDKDGQPIEVEASILRFTERVLAVQKVEMVEGDFAYMALHVPSGSHIGHYAFADAEAAERCLWTFWERLTFEQKGTLAGAYEAIVKDQEMAAVFMTSFGMNADYELTNKVPEE